MKGNLSKTTNEHDVLLTVIVTVYNLEFFIGECLESIINQTHTNLEIIVVNDGSTDRSSSIIDYYKQHDLRIITINQDNTGVSVARNRAIDIASGALLTFVDGDDVLDLDTYERNIRLFFDDIEADVVQFPIMYRWKGKNPQKRSLEKSFAGEDDLLAGYLNGHISFSTCDKIFRKNIFENIRFRENIRYEDMYLCYDLIVRIKKLVVTKDGCYFYRMHALSFSNQRAEFKKLKNYLAAAKMFNDAALKYNWLQPALGYFSLCILCNIAGGYYSLNSKNERILLRMDIIGCSFKLFVQAINQRIVSKKIFLFGLVYQTIGVRLSLIIYGFLFTLYYKSSENDFSMSSYI